MRFRQSSRADQGSGPGAGVLAWLAWLAATALAVVVAWVGLSPVLDVAVPDRAAPLSAAEVRHLAVPSAPPVPTPTPTRSPSPSPSASPSASPSPSPSGRSGTATRPATTRPPTGSPTVVDGWTVTTQSDGTVSYLRGFQTPGGSTVIRMTPGQVSLVSAAPNPDYTVDTAQPDPTRLVVRFIAGNKVDIVDAIWWNDRPYAEVSHVG